MVDREKETQHNIVLQPKHKANNLLLMIDEQLFSIVDDRLKKCQSIDEYKEVWDFLKLIKTDGIQLHYETELKTVELNKRKTDLLFYKIQRILSLFIGFGLFVSSFFIFPTNSLIGGIFFGTGLGALGIATYSLKSLLNK